MKLATAASILGPTIVSARRIERPNALARKFQTTAADALPEPTSADPHLHSKKNLEEHSDASSFSRELTNFHADSLTATQNKRQEREQERLIECLPDAGILSCYEDELHCQPDFYAHLGGLCVPHMLSKMELTETDMPATYMNSSMVSSRNRHTRVLQGAADGAAIIEEKCNNNDRCDCSALDVETGSGAISCRRIENVSLEGRYDGCATTYGDVISIDTFTNNELLVTTDCYELTNPTAQQTVCLAKDPSDTTCQITLDGQLCASCSIVDFEHYEFNCTNVPNGRLGSTEVDILDFLPILQDCYGTSNSCENLCGAEGIPEANRDKTIPLPGGGSSGSLSCGYLATIGASGRIPLAFCDGLQAAALSRCCTTPSPIMPPGTDEPPQSAPVEPAGVGCTLCQEGTGQVVNPYEVIEDYGLFCFSFRDFALISITDSETCDEVNNKVYQQCCIPLPGSPSASPIDPETSSAPQKSSLFYYSGVLGVLTSSTLLITAHLLLDHF